MAKTRRNYKSCFDIQSSNRHATRSPQPRTPARKSSIAVLSPRLLPKCCAECTLGFTPTFGNPVRNASWGMSSAHRREGGSHFPVNNFGEFWILG
jgi:hypothetical protein